MEELINLVREIGPSQLRTCAYKVSYVTPPPGHKDDIFRRSNAPKYAGRIKAFNERKKADPLKYEMLAWRNKCILYEADKGAEELFKLLHDAAAVSHPPSEPVDDEGMRNMIRSDWLDGVTVKDLSTKYGQPRTALVDIIEKVYDRGS